MTRTSHALRGVLHRLRAAGLHAEAAMIEAEADRIQKIELALEAVLAGLEDPGAAGLDEPITFPARHVLGTTGFEWRQVRAAE